jgi:hypothetical protein
MFAPPTPSIREGRAGPGSVKAIDYRNQSIGMTVAVL